MLSIIIPVYNGGKYLISCLRSLELANRNVELIIVDDCSQDGSLKLVEDFRRAKRNCHITIIRNSENAGAGYSRNIGIYRAKGKYLTFLDSDDWLTSGAIDRWIEIIETTKSEVIGFGSRSHKLIEGGFQVATELPEIENGTINPKNVILIEKGLHPMPWGYLFQSRFLRANHIFFPEGRYFEDVPFVTSALLHAKAASTVPLVLYNYRVHDTSITQSYSAKKIVDSLSGHFQIRLILENLKLYQSLKPYYELRLLLYCIYPNYKDYFLIKFEKGNTELDALFKDILKDLKLMDVSGLLGRTFSAKRELSPTQMDYRLETLGFILAFRSMPKLIRGVWNMGYRISRRSSSIRYWGRYICSMKWCALIAYYVFTISRMKLKFALKP